VVSNARRGRGTLDFDIHVTDRDGRPRGLNISILVDGSGEDVTVLHLFRDVTHERLVSRLASSLPEQPVADRGETITSS